MHRQRKVFCGSQDPIQGKCAFNSDQIHLTESGAEQFICKRKYKMAEWVSAVLRVWSDVYFVGFSTRWNSNCCRAEKWMSALSEQLVTLMDQFSSEEKWKAAAAIQGYRFTEKVLTVLRWSQYNKNTLLWNSRVAFNDLDTGHVCVSVCNDRTVAL